MYKIIFIVFFTFSLLYGQQNSLIGPGIWNVISIKKYEPRLGDDLYMNCDTVKRRLNRTHEGYNITCQFEKELDESYEVEVDVYKKVDGGYKPYQLLKEESITRFLQKYTNENTKNFLTAAGVDPPEFPVPAGTYNLRNYVIDYCNLPPNSPYGEYEATACVLKLSQRVCCVTAIVEFTEDSNDICGYE